MKELFLIDSSGFSEVLAVSISFSSFTVWAARALSLTTDKFSSTKKKNYKFCCCCSLSSIKSNFWSSGAGWDGNEELPESGWAMMMILRQSSSWLSWLGLNIAIHFVVDPITCWLLLMRFGSRWRLMLDRCFSKLLLDLQVRVDGVHAKVEIAAVLLIVLWANMWTDLVGWSENVGRSAALNGQNGNIK